MINLWILGLLVYLNIGVWFFLRERSYYGQKQPLGLLFVYLIIWPVMVLANIEI